jgi:hypothetical protein
VSAGRNLARSRVFFAAAHVVGVTDERGRARLDWDATLAYRHHLWGCGLGVAEAMDTAQRGMGLDWEAARELIRRSAADAQSSGARIACGAGTDQLPAGPASVREIERAYLEQCAFVEEQGCPAIVMASRALAAAAQGRDDYLRVYGAILDRVAQPVILHWLGDMFDPALAGYWGTSDPAAATDTILELIATHPDKIDGIKISLLDPAHELALRRRLPPGVRCYTGDDLNYVDLIVGDDEGASDALLGVFDAIAPVAGAALEALDDGDQARFRALLEPTIPLARQLFTAPTYHYKTGIVFLAYLGGHQDSFRMLGGLETGRSCEQLRTTFALAVEAGVIDDVELARERMERVLNTAAGAPA